MKTSLRMFLLLMFFGGPLLLFCQQDEQVIDRVQKAVREANAADLAAWFHTTVDLELGKTDGNFSKNQAEMILKDFFSKNPVKTYTAKHKGSSDDGSKYIIGLYLSKSDQEYRVYILLKQQDAGLRINQLQFEED